MMATDLPRAGDHAAAPGGRGRGAAWLHGLDTALLWLAMAAFIVMMLSVLSQILFRYVLEISVPWTEELARLLFVQSMLIGMALAIRRHEHIVVDFLFRRLPPRPREALAVVFGLAILLLLLLLTTGAFSMIGRNWNARLVSLPFVRVGYLYLGLVACFGLMAFYTTLNLVARLRALLAGTDEPAP
jgi:TRAP-type C4-dicarboxylate transport system permease small subunit